MERQSTKIHNITLTPRNQFIERHYSDFDPITR